MMLCSIAVDPEVRQEFEKRQKEGPLGMGGSATNPMGGFDMAAWMAGSKSPSSAPGGSNEAPAAPAAPARSGGKAKRRG